MFRRRVPVILQIEAAECGAASLAMVLAYYGHYVDMSTMRADCKISRDGSRMSLLMEAAKKHGLVPRALRAQAELADVPLPAIVFWKFNHFIVVESMRRGKVTVCDPALGRRVISFEDFKKDYSGVALALERGPNFECRGKPFRILPAIFSITRGDGAAYAYLAVLTLMLNVIGLLLPGLTRLFVDDYLPALAGRSMVSYFTVLAALVAVQLALLLIKSHTLSRFERILSAETSARVMRRALFLPISYFQQRSRSALVSKLDSTDAVSAFISGQLVPMALGGCFAAIYLGLLFFYNFTLTSVVITITIAVLTAIRVLIRKSGESMQNCVNERQRFFGSMVQTLRLFDTIKATAGEDAAYQRLSADYNTYENATQRAMALAAYTEAIPIAVPLIFQIVSLALGGAMVVAGSMSVGMLLAYQSLALSFFAPITQLINQFSQIQSLTPNVKGVLDIVNEPEDPIASRDEGENSEETLRGEVELEGLSFRYNPAMPPVIDAISIKVSAGKSVAFVGASGSGKTTILKLLEGLHQPQSGAVLLDGRPLMELPRGLVARSMSVAGQTPYLFEGTVRENLAMFDDTIDQTELIRAARDACIHDDITQMTGGYDARLTEGGGNLSGGQRQRLMIARALVGNPAILILDEATSALDTLVEERIMSNIRARGLTLIIVAHRLSTIRDCDEIVVLEKGRIVERGSHEALMAGDCARYKSLVSAGGDMA